MTPTRPLRRPLAKVAALIPLALLLVPAATASGQDLGYQRLSTSDGTRLDYRLVKPREERETYPVLLALPPGPQTLSMVNWGLDTYYREQALERGWVIVSPVAPGGRRFVDGAEQYLPELLAEVARTYPPEGGKFYLAGVSNGGLSSFRIAMLHPELFHAIGVLPGWPAPTDLDQIDRLRSIPLRMWAGERENPSWLALMQQAEARLRSLEADVELIVLPGEGHTLASLAGGEVLFRFLESTRP